MLRFTSISACWAVNSVSAFLLLQYELYFGAICIWVGSNYSKTIHYANSVVSHVFIDLFSAYYSDICVGSIACRLEKKEGGSVRVYIMTLGVLAPYRGLGIGKQYDLILSLSYIFWQYVLF